MAQMNPTITLHGSDAETMVRDRINVISHLQDALAQFGNLAPHQRDYADLDTYHKDRAIHFERIGGLNKLIADLTAEGLAIQEKAR